MAEMPEKNNNPENSSDITDGNGPGPFGLLETDRPMMPGEDKIPAKDDKGFKTTGEKFYDRLQYAIANIFILTATAVIAYISQYGKDKYGKIPNYLKRAQDTLNKKVWNSPTAPLRERPGKSEIPIRIGQAISSSTVLFWGGALFAPVLRWMENHREAIATYANKRWGKQGEVEAGHNRLKDSPKQTWGDVIKGRIAAWLIVFSSFTTFDVTNALLRKDKSKPFLLDKYVGGFGKKVTEFTKGGKEIVNNPEALKNNKTYQFSTILALDLYATTAALIVWNAISRFSAARRILKKAEAAKLPVSETSPQQQNEATQTQEKGTDAQTKSFTAREGGKPKDFYAHAAETQTTPGHAV